MERIFDWKFRSIFFMRAILWRDDCRLRGAIDFHYHHHQNKAVLWGRRPVDWSQALLRNRWHQCWNVDANSTSQKQHLSGCKQRVVVEGASSDELDVSGVPQGSVLGPCLLLYYIKDIAQGLTSTVRLVADDTMIYMAIKSDQDAKALQKDLDMLCYWENKWTMEFHHDKCEILSSAGLRNLAALCGLNRRPFCL